MNKAETMEIVLQLNIERQLEWLADFGMFLTIAARSGYPIRDAPGNLNHLMAFNEIQHAAYGRMKHIRDGTA
jgi:hypothetical protein